MTTTKIQINRAPVLTLWAAVVAEHLGYDRDEALSLGKALSGLNAQSKGKRLGIYTEGKDEGKGDEKPEGKAEGAQEKLEFVELMDRGIPAVHTPQGLRASIKGEMIQPEPVTHYLEQKFKDHLAEARAAMEKLAASTPRGKLAEEAFALYEKFRPSIPEGMKGWGAKGELDLRYILKLAE